jgi:hypothetical protein
MTKLEYTVSFTTPAFLGNADQQARREAFSTGKVSQGDRSVR